MAILFSFMAVDSIHDVFFRMIFSYVVSLIGILILLKTRLLLIMAGLLTFIKLFLYYTKSRKFKNIKKTVCICDVSVMYLLCKCKFTLHWWQMWDFLPLLQVDRSVGGFLGG